MAETRTLARPYGKAAFLRAVCEHTLEKWSRFLQRLSEVSKSHEVKQFIQAPQVSLAQKVSFFMSWVDEEDRNLESENFLRIIAHHKKLHLLPDICILYEEFRRKHERILAVEFFSAKPLEKDHEEKFRTALIAYLGQNIVFSVRVDPTLLGGALVRAGDVVIDGSLKGRLQKLKETFGK